jgi:hypothetical protein
MGSYTDRADVFNPPNLIDCVNRHQGHVVGKIEDDDVESMEGVEVLLE